MISKILSIFFDKKINALWILIRNIKFNDIFLKHYLHHGAKCILRNHNLNIISSFDVNGNRVEWLLFRNTLILKMSCAI